MKKEKEIVVETFLEDGVVCPTDDTVALCFPIGIDICDSFGVKNVLSRVKASIISIERWMPQPEEPWHRTEEIEELSPLKGRPLELVLLQPKIGLKAWMYITRQSFNDELRDYGVIPGHKACQYKFKLKIEELEPKKE